MRLRDINWKRKEDRWEFIKSREKHRRQTMMSQYREWFIDVAYYAGHQNIFHDKSNRRLWENRGPSYRVKSISNILLPLARSFVSNMAQVEPIWQVLPATKSQEDIQIAELNTDVLHHYWQSLKIYYKYIKALYWTVTTGNGFLKVGWDGNEGKKVVIPEDDELDRFFNAIGIAKPPSGKVALGEPFVDWKSPFELMFQNGVDNPQDSIYSIESIIRDPYMVQDKYGKNRTKHLKPEQELIENGLFYLDRLNSLNEAILKGSLSGRDIDQEKVVVYEVNIRPHEQLEKGMKFIMAQGEDLIKPQPFPYEHGMIPYVHLPEIPIPGRLWATSTLHQNRPSQAILNRFDSQVIEYINLMLKGKWLVPRGAGLAQGAITDAPGEIIKYNHPFKPEQGRLLAFPRSIFDQRNILKQSIQDVASSHEPSQGKAAGSVRAASLARELKQSDLAVLGPTQLIHDMALGDLGRMLISIISQFVREDRVLSVIRSNKLSVSRSFTGKMLVGKKFEQGADYFNVIVAQGGRAPWSKILQQQVLGELLQSGFLRPGVHDQLVFKAIGLDNAEVIFELPEQARSVQLDENKLLDQGQPVEVEKHNLHSVHIEQIDLHLENIVSSQMPDNIKALYRKHRDDHMRMQAIMEVLPEILKAQAVSQLQSPLGLNPDAGPSGANGTQRGTQRGRG